MSDPKIDEKDPLKLSKNTQKLMEVAEEEARKEKSGVVGTEHVLIALLKSDGIAAGRLKAMGVTLEGASKPAYGVTSSSLTASLGKQQVKDLSDDPEEDEEDEDEAETEGDEGNG